MAGAADPKCIFCRLARRELPVDVVSETERCFAFNDINPQAPRHVVVIPKAHIPDLQAATADDFSLIGEMAQLAQQIAEDDEFADSGYRLVINNGRDAGQSVSHVHMHVLAGRSLAWPPG